MRSSIAKRIGVLESYVTVDRDKQVWEYRRQLAQVARESDAYLDLGYERTAIRQGIQVELTRRTGGKPLDGTVSLDDVDRFLKSGGNPAAASRLAEIETSQINTIVESCEARGFAEAANYFRESMQESNKHLTAGK